MTVEDYLSKFKTKIEANKNSIINYLTAKYDAVYISAMNGKNKYLKRELHNNAHIQIWNGKEAKYCNGEADTTVSNTYFFLTFATTSCKCNAKDMQERCTDLCFSVRKDVVDAADTYLRFLWIGKEYLFDCNRDYISDHIAATRVSQGVIWYDVHMKTNLLIKKCNKLPNPDVFNINNFQPKYIEHVTYSKYRFRGSLYQVSIYDSNQKLISTAFVKSAGQLYELYLSNAVDNKNQLYYALRCNVNRFEDKKNGKLYVVTKVDSVSIEIEASKEPEEPIEEAEVYVASDIAEEPEKVIIELTSTVEKDDYNRYLESLTGI